MDTVKYVAFLRGINVGGKSIIKMETLRQVFESMGFHNVKTLLNSGNVIFETAKVTRQQLTSQIEKQLKESFGRDLSIIVRTLDEIQTLVGSDPFKSLTITPQTRLYVTFFSKELSKDERQSPESSDKDFKIIRVSDDEVCSVLTLSPDKGTTDLMSDLEKKFGKKLTTRNWSTVQRLINSK